MFNTIFGDNFYLNTQYFRATGERYLLENPERQARFVSFYEERRQLGRNLFRQLRRQNHNLTNDRTLELFAGEIDSIGVLFNTRVVDRDVSPLRINYNSNILRVRMQRENTYNNILVNNYLLNHDATYFRIGTWDNHARVLFEFETTRYSRTGSCERVVSCDVDLSDYDRYVLLNPRDREEEIIMRNLINSNDNAYVGYFGSNNDLDRCEHEEEIRNLQETTGAQLLANLSLDNGYAYILRNRSRRR